MLNLLQVEGFKSVGPRVTVDLAPLTALYGPAGAGKSTCLAALKFFKTAMADGTQAAAAAVGGDLRHQAAGWRGRAVRLRLVAQLAGSAVDYALALHVQGDRVTVARERLTCMAGGKLTCQLTRDTRRATCLARGQAKPVTVAALDTTRLAAAARQLGIGRRTLYRKLKAYQLEGYRHESRHHPARAARRRLG